jgi:hypothetical protein
MADGRVLYERVKQASAEATWGSTGRSSSTTKALAMQTHFRQAKDFEMMNRGRRFASGPASY